MGLRFEVWGFRLRVQYLVFGVERKRLSVEGLGFVNLGLVFVVYVSGWRLQGAGFVVQSIWLRV